MRARDGHRGRPRAEFLVPCLDRVRAGRQAFDRERAVGRAHREVRMRHHADVRRHPGVHVALEAHHHLGHGERLLHARALTRLAHVEFLVHHRQRVDVVQRGVAVDDLERLADAHAEDPRRVPAAFLIERDRCRGDVEGVGRIEAVLHVDERVLECAVLADEHGLALYVRAGALRADGIDADANHVDGVVACRQNTTPSGDVTGRGRVDVLVPAPPVAAEVAERSSPRRRRAPGLRQRQKRERVFDGMARGDGRGDERRMSAGNNQLWPTSPDAARPCRLPRGRWECYFSFLVWAHALMRVRFRQPGGGIV